MKVDIIVEKFDNGISLKWSSPGQDDECIVALEEEQAYTIGKMIWNDIMNEMNNELKNVVKLNIEYKAI